MKNKEVSWTECEECQGNGTKTRRFRKNSKLYKQNISNELETNNNKNTRPPLNKHLITCSTCSGSGLNPSDSYPIADKETYPQVAIIGGGIGGVALAVACLHRKIPFTIFERDNSFDARSQGYGLTLQQASKAIKGFGLFSLKEGLISTRHVVHNTEGKELVEWGKRISNPTGKITSQKRVNIHIPRQSLRLALLEQLVVQDTVHWGHQLIDFKEFEDKSVELTFQVNGKTKKTKADLVVGADGIRSTVRKLLIGEESTPLRYLGCMVILGICPLNNLKDLNSPLLDSATVFQTVNGSDRIYIMPFSSDSIMWQFSFPISEQKAKTLSEQGAKALKNEAYSRMMQWHSPIPQIIENSPATEITGYPAYDRELLDKSLLENGGPITLIGDAAHPMSPFKGQGANQALLDALSLAREITNKCSHSSQWRESGIRKSILTEFESEMLSRSASKVKASAEAVKLLHSKRVLREGDGPKGRALK
jgi:2-polyprenyl-6-methoxyphenol hydroxylase-like FAD-dependent oxidoreductase